MRASYEDYSFAHEIFADPSKTQHRNKKAEKVTATFSPASTFDLELITGSEAYRRLVEPQTLRELAEASHRLAREIQDASGLRHVDIVFAPGANKREISVHYEFGTNIAYLQFPHIARRLVGAIEGVFSKRSSEKDKWYHSVVNGSMLARYKYLSDQDGYSAKLEKQWEKAVLGLDSAFGLKYSSRWLDLNAKENAWTKSLKLIYDINEETKLYKHRCDLRYPNRVYAGLIHKSRSNLIDSNRSSPDILKAGLYPDSLLLLRVGHKNLVEKLLGGTAYVKNRIDLGYNGTDPPFAKYKGYMRLVHGDLKNSKVALYNSLLLEKSFSKEPMKVNDACFLRGVKGVHEFPGAKTYRNQLEVENQHLGDRVPNHFTALYEAKLIFPKLKPFSKKFAFAKISPYIYGTAGCSIPFGSCLTSDIGNKTLGSAGFGLMVIAKTFTVDLYYSVAGFRQPHDMQKDFGLYIGLN